MNFLPRPFPLVTATIVATFSWLLILSPGVAGVPLLAEEPQSAQLADPKEVEVESARVRGQLQG